ncbi:MAG: PLP-dependent transferase, partial [Gemmatimonadota bacterium]
TLEVRFARMCGNAQALAQRHAEHRKVDAVSYPGLPSHPAHALAKAQMASFGALIGVTLADKGAAERFIDACGFIRSATSFGGVHTSAERRARWGDQVAEGFIRLSVGCEPTEVLWAEIERALSDV